jgi:hypothetical protein
MEIVRVHPKGFKFFFYLYHGIAAVGFILTTGFLFQIIPYNSCFISGILMMSIPFLVVPPELTILLKDQKLIFRHRINCSTIAFEDISRVELSTCSVDLINCENNTLLKISSKYFKNIKLSELSEYIRGLLSGNREIDPARYAAVNFKGCKFIGWCISQLGKTAGSGLHS